MNKKSGTAGFYGGDKYSDAGGILVRLAVLTERAAVAAVLVAVAYVVFTTWRYTRNTEQSKKRL